MKRTALICCLLTVVSCKTNASSDVKDDSKLRPEDGSEKILVIFESLPIGESIKQRLGANQGSKVLFVGKAQSPDKKDLIVLYSTDQQNLRLVSSKEVIDLTALGESVSWTQAKRTGKANGKFLNLENNLVNELCTGGRSAACKLGYNDGKYTFEVGGQSMVLENLKSYAMIGVKPSYDSKESLKLKFEFATDVLPLNVTEEDNTEYSLGIKCDGNSYTVDYFSNQINGLKQFTISDFALKAQRSIWNKEGTNLMIDDIKYDRDFIVKSEGKSLSLEFKGDLMKKLKSECGDKIPKNAFVIDGALIRPI